LAALDLIPVDPVRHGIHIFPEAAQQLIRRGVLFQQRIQVALRCLGLLLRGQIARIGPLVRPNGAETTVLARELFLVRWRDFIESIEDGFGGGVVGVFERAGLFGRQMFRGQFKGEAPATAR
jgi:hypothetical protein